MRFEWTALNFWTLVIAILTVAMMRARFTTRIDTPWAMVYYIALVLYVRSVEGEYNNYVIFAGVVAALFLRFEFMGGFFLKLFRTAEFVVHCYVLVMAFLILMTRTY